MKKINLLCFLYIVYFLQTEAQTCVINVPNNTPYTTDIEQNFRPRLTFQGFSNPSMINGAGLKQFLEMLYCGFNNSNSKIHVGMMPHPQGFGLTPKPYITAGWGGTVLLGDGQGSEGKNVFLDSGTFDAFIDGSIFSGGYLTPAMGWPGYYVLFFHLFIYD